jgi:ADP-sugar diphosphatase
MNAHTIDVVEENNRVFWQRTADERVMIFGSTTTTTEELLSFCSSLLFNDWAQGISPNIAIEAITVVSVDNRPNGQAIFAKLAVTAKDKTGRKLPGVIFLRGGSVAILPILTAKENGQKYVVFTEQYRLAVGDDALVEIPAGMLDGSGDFVGVTAKEFEEEIGIPLKNDELIPLSPILELEDEMRTPYSKGIVISPGACDEVMRFFLFERELPLAEILALKGKLTGNREEGELIKLRIIELDNVTRFTRDAKFYAAYALAILQSYI